MFREALGWMVFVGFVECVGLFEDSGSTMNNQLLLQERVPGHHGSATTWSNQLSQADTNDQLTREKSHSEKNTASTIWGVKPMTLPKK